MTILTTVDVINRLEAFRESAQQGHTYSLVDELQRQIDELEPLKRTGPYFPDSNCQRAYAEYEAILETGVQAGGKETSDAAIKFLGAICDYYLNKFDGDFMKIERVDTWQR